MIQKLTCHRVIHLLLWIMGIYLFFRFLFTPLLPFLLALGVCTLLEPLVQRIQKAMKVTRSFAAVTAASTMLLILGGAATVLSLLLGEEFSTWSARLPEVVDSVPLMWNRAHIRVASWYASCPAFLRNAFDHITLVISENTSAIAGKIGSFLVDKISSFAAVLPNIVLFCVTTILALYFTAINYSTILAFLKRQLPPVWQTRCRSAAQCCRSAMLKWLCSELILIATTFAIMLLGFLWMGIDFAFLAAFFVAVVDALPVLGAGAVLIPWAIFSFLLGDTGRMIALLALYATALLLRSFLEPKLLAGQANLPSISILLAMYLGFHFFGITGMLLLPVLLLLLKQMQDAGVITFWR